MVTTDTKKKTPDDGVTHGETKGLAPIHYVHELPQADEERLEKLFKTLDRDGNGRIDIADLSAALKDVGISHKYAEVCKSLCVIICFIPYSTLVLIFRKSILLLF